MLSELYISNFALIDKITIKFDDGLNIFTGSTGVGKSLVIGALNFLLGSRATSDIVRDKDKAVTVSGVFHVRNKQMLEIINKKIEDIDDDEIIIQRNLDRNGRNRCRLNDQPITVSLLKEIGELLVNIHGQHEHESLTNPRQQLLILDGFGKLDDLRTGYSEIYELALTKEKMLRSFNDRMDERKNQIDLYNYETDEIDAAMLKPEEIDTLEVERNILANAEKIQNVLSHCTNSLYESDDSVISRLKEIANEMDKIRDIDKGFENSIEVCNQSIYQLEDVAATLRNDIEKYISDPGRMEQIEEWINEIRRLVNKYGGSVEEVLSYCCETKVKLEKLLKENKDVGTTEKDLQDLKKTIIKVGRDLSKRRGEAAQKLSALIRKELKELGIANGKFDINLSSIDITDLEHIDLGEAGSSGFDSVEFMFSSNPGEGLKPLRKVASGGEISRVMLALKRHLASADQTPVLIFDEIDANIGGRMGRVIGEKLMLVSQSHQVICITHLPQIASYAEQHHKVNKTVKSNRTYVTMQDLSAKERLEEVAEMIRGDEKTDVTRKQAKEMLDDANKFRKQKLSV